MTCGQYHITGLVSEQVQQNTLHFQNCNSAPSHSECSLLFPVASINTVKVTVSAAACVVTMVTMNNSG
jgi:hypothetical protein